MAKKSTPNAPAAKPAPLAVSIRAALDSIPDGPYWATYADICRIMGRPVSHALAIASAAAKVDGYVRWDQVRNAEGVFRPMGDGGRVSTDAAGRAIVHSADQIDKWARARKLVVGANGRADKSQQITWNGAQWVLVKGGAPVTAKVRAPRKPRAAKPATVPAAPVAETVPTPEAPQTEAPMADAG